MVVAHVNSDGLAKFASNVQSVGLTTSSNILPVSDDTVDIGANRGFATHI